MSNEAARQFIAQAIDAIQTGRHRQAVDLLDRAIQLDGSDSEAFVLRGVACSALGENAEASDAFRTAVELAPHNAKAFYNFAVHLYGVRDSAGALEMAREAVRVDPMHGQARELATRIEREVGAAPLYLPPPMAPVSPEGAEQPQLGTEFTPSLSGAQYFRDPRSGDGYQLPVHSIAFIERSAKVWDVIGWLLAAFSLAMFVRSVVIFVGVFPELQSAIYANGQLPSSLTASPALIILSVGLQLLLLIWTCFDLADRRSNWIWLFPWIVACCCGTNWIVHIFYMLTGRPSR